MALAGRGAAICYETVRFGAHLRRPEEEKRARIGGRFAFPRPPSRHKSLPFVVGYTNSTVVTQSSEPSGAILGLSELRARCKKWQWKGQYSINYFVSSSSSSSSSGSESNPPLLLVHGFGASIPHWRRNIGTLAENHTVYTIDLLGFGASDKPKRYQYTMEGWAESLRRNLSALERNGDIGFLILDFLNEVVQKPAVLIGNSVGSLACVIAASESRQNLVHGLVLLNCAGGMNNKAIVDDWRIKLLLPLLWLFDFLLKQDGIAATLFKRIKERENLKNILSSIYGNKEAVDDELVEIIREPADEEGALDAFVSIITGPPGPNPMKLMPRIDIPVLVLWGDQDPFTPIDGPVGKFFSSLPSRSPNVSLHMLEGVGHCPHDDRPELVHEKLLPWLTNLAAV